MSGFQTKLEESGRGLIGEDGLTLLNYKESDIMGTKKGQVRKTARRAYEPKIYRIKKSKQGGYTIRGVWFSTFSGASAAASNPKLLERFLKKK